MKLLIDLQTNSIITQQESDCILIQNLDTQEYISHPMIFGGPWGDWQRQGRAIWIDSLENEELEDCDIIPGDSPTILNPGERSETWVMEGIPPKVIVNEERKASRLASQPDKTLIVQLKDNIQKYDINAATEEDQKQFQKDISDALTILLQKL